MWYWKNYQIAIKHEKLIYIIKNSTSQRIKLTNSVSIEIGDIIFVPEKIDYDTSEKKEDEPSPLEKAKTIKVEKLFKSKDDGNLPIKEMYKFV